MSFFIGWRMVICRQTAIAENERRGAVRTATTRTHVEELLKAADPTLPLSLFWAASDQALPCICWSRSLNAFMAFSYYPLGYLDALG